MQTCILVSIYRLVKDRSELKRYLTGTNKNYTDLSIQLERKIEIERYIGQKKNKISESIIVVLRNWSTAKEIPGFWQIKMSSGLMHQHYYSQIFHFLSNFSEQQTDIIAVSCIMSDQCLPKSTIDSEGTKNIA